jgi:hypothetical protein
METTNKTNQNEINFFVSENFNDFRRIGNTYYINLEIQNKVKKLDKLKEYLNIHSVLYIVSICFSGGSSKENYTTIAKVEIIE